MLQGLYDTGSRDASICALLGQAHANLGRWDESEHWCRQAIQQDKLSLDAYYILAYQYIAAYLNSVKTPDRAYHPLLGQYLADAEALLAKHGYVPEPEIPSESGDREEALRIATWLDEFNNGRLASEGGPVHCE